MADIKSLSIFGSKNKGLDQIKEFNKEPKDKTINNENKKNNTSLKAKTKKTKRNTNPKGAGAPIRNFDRVFVAAQPIKLSALLNATTRNLTEKYMSEFSKDELLRRAVNDYIKLNMTKEDKKALLQDIERDLNLYRERHPTIAEVDFEGNEIKGVEQIEHETLEELKRVWGI